MAKAGLSGVGVLKENLHKLDRGSHWNGSAASSKPHSWPLYLLAQIALETSAILNMRLSSNTTVTSYHSLKYPLKRRYT